jgi:hypothetical protein
MAVYIPTDNTQSTKYTATALKAQTKEYQAFGPPPPNCYTARTSGGNGMVYADNSVNNAVISIPKGGTYTHPCSDAGMKARPPPTYAAEYTFGRASSPGFFNPPVKYVSPQIKWHFYSGGWQAALAAELQKKSYDITAD